MQLSLGLAETGLLTLKRANAMRLPTSPKHQPNQLTPRHGSPVAFYLRQDGLSETSNPGHFLTKTRPPRTPSTVRFALQCFE